MEWVISNITDGIQNISMPKNLLHSKILFVSPDYDSNKINFGVLFLNKVAANEQFLIKTFQLFIPYSAISMKLLK